MILQALLKLAENEGLVPNPDYEFRRISWQIEISAEGNLQAIHPYRIDLNAANDQKSKFVGRWSSVPRQPIRTSGAKSFFMVDKAEYVLGLDPTGSREQARLDERNKLFRDQIDELVAATNNKSAQAIKNFLDNIESHRSDIKTGSVFQEMEPNDLLGFAIAGHWVHLDKAVVAHWSKVRAESVEKLEIPFQCLVTGNPVYEIPLFPLLKKVPGGTSSGVALVSHNAKAFYSYGLDGGENAPVTRVAAEICGDALARLLDETFPNPKNLEEAMPRRVIRLGSNTAVCFWAKEKDPEVVNYLDALPDLLSGDNENEERVSSAYQSIWSGQAVPLKKTSEFYALTISGTQGRAIIRDWLETSLHEVNENLALHFRDLAVCRNTNPKKGTTYSPAVPMNWLLKSLAAEGRSEPVPPSVETGFVRAAIKGIPYPLQMLQRALVRMRAEAGGDEWVDSVRRDARAAVIKAVLNRQRRRELKSNPKFNRYPEVDVEMNPNLENPGYSLGMLTAVLEKLQSLALGDVNASLVDRFFSAASASPRSVFVRLLKNSQHHFRKARDSNEKYVPGNARYMERIKDEIISRFNVSTESETDQNASMKKRRPAYPQNSGIPIHLSLEDQGLFVLGYHQMRHWIFLNKEDRAKWEQKYPDAPKIFLRKKQEDIETESELVDAESN